MEIIINPDKEYVKKMRQALKDNQFFCPCKLIRNEDTKCMCKEFVEQTENGFCNCGLYYKKV